MRRITTFLCVAVLALAVAMRAPARAEPRSGPDLWHVTHVTDPGTGKFSYCAVESGFDNRLYLAFARNREFNTNIVVSFPDKRLQDHGKYRMSVVVDGKAPRDITGFAADSTILVIPLLRDAKLIGSLQNGKLLELKGPQDSVKFALDGAGAAFRKLQLCVEDSLKDEVQHGAQGTHVPPSAEMPSSGASGSETAATVEPLPLPGKPSTPPPATGIPAEPVSQASAEPAVTDAQMPAPPAPLSVPKPTPATVPAEVPQPVAVAPAEVASTNAPQVSLTPPAAPSPTVSAFQSPASAGMPSSTVAASPSPAAADVKPFDLSPYAILVTGGLHAQGHCTEHSQTCTWSDGALIGSIGQRSARDPSFLDEMMDDADRRESACKGQFSSSLGGPVLKKGVTVAEATYACALSASSLSDVVLYISEPKRIVIIDETVTPANHDGAFKVRANIESGLELGINYK